MGLDMYLDKEIYIGAEYKHREVTGTIDIKTCGTPIPVNFNKVSRIVERAMYWRKANAIHRFFVEQVQDGNDDCGRYYVSTEVMQDLLKRCQRVLDNHDLAQELLPTQSGFFFGSTEYDEWYFKDLQNTINELKDFDEKADYFYTSSW